MKTKGERLRWARERRYRSGRAAAFALDVAVSTYNAHERAGEPGARDYSEEEAFKYARKFRVSASWLLTGEGTANRSTVVDVVGTVGLGEAIRWVEEGELALGEIELPYALPEGCFALEARGQSQFPRIKDGEVVIAKWYEGEPEALIGQEVVLEDAEGTYLLKTLKKHARDGSFTIGSHNAPDQDEVDVKRVAEVMSIVPAKQWKRIAS